MNVPPAPSLAQQLLGTTRGKLIAYSSIAVLGVLLMWNPMVFYIALVAGLVLASPRIGGPLSLPATTWRYNHLAAAGSSWLALVVAAAWMAFSSTLPPDDLMRHINSAGWGYNYVPHFEHHILPTKWSWTIGFDVMVGAVHAITGDVLTTARIVRAIETLLVGGSLLLAIQRATTSRPLQFAAFCIAMMGIVWPRLQFGRPEILFAGLVFAAVWARRGLWLLFYAACTGLYAFSPIYAVAAVLLGSPSEPFAKRMLKNIAVLGAALALSLTFWMLYSGGEYPIVFNLLSKVLQVQSDNKITVGELLPLVAIMASPVALLVLAVLFYAAWVRVPALAKEPQARTTLLLLLAVSLYFCLPNYVRYASIIWGLLTVAVVTVASAGQRSEAGPGWLWAAGILFVALHITPRADPIPADVLKTMRVPAGSRILAPFNRSAYIATSANPDAIVTPIFDLSAVTQPAQDLVRALTEGKLDCARALAFNFDFLIENTIEGTPPACVSLVAVQGSQRLWRFTKASASK